MSKNITDITNRILQSNQDLHSGPSIVLKEIESIKKDINRLSTKLDRIYQLLQQIRDRDSY